MAVEAALNGGGGREEWRGRADWRWRPRERAVGAVNGTAMAPASETAALPAGGPEQPPDQPARRAM
jgi:hypothetical protein